MSLIVLTKTVLPRISGPKGSLLNGSRGGRPLLLLQKEKRNTEKSVTRYRDKQVGVERTNGTGEKSSVTQEESSSSDSGRD
jgi:hypothetical protein